MSSGKSLRVSDEFATHWVPMIELLAILVASVALGVIRPRRSTLVVAVVPTALAFAWLVLHEDIPGDPLGLADLAWYAGMSLAVGAFFALAIAVGVAVGRRAGRSAERRA